ncbi:MAG: hypothetical protein KY469_06455 [Actinobacteria bacterium]|nr:hypothetical protein [Actinomycetota bacterium]
MLTRWRGEDGAITVFVVALVPAIMLVAGLVYDGGRLLAARREAHDLADNAARAAAQEVDVDALRSARTPVVEPLAAQAAGEAYLAATGHTGTVVVTADRVEVTVSITTSMALLQLAGISERTVTATGHARIVRGVTEPES